MNKQQYDSVISGMHKTKEILKNSKLPVPTGALTDQNTFRHLPVGTLFWKVWSLGPGSWITPAKTRKESVEDHKQDHLGPSFVVDWKEQFAFSDLTDDKYKHESYRKYKTDFYDSYNLGPGAYNDSYIFLNSEDAEAYLAVCKLRPRFKSEEERIQHEELMKEMDRISDEMTYDYVEDDRY